MEEIKKLARELEKWDDVVVLTGAGASTESGIPDFRSPDGLWSKMDPMELFARSVLESKPALFWQRAEPIFRDLISAKPNPCHYALAQLEEMGLIRGVITQNIDGLHQQAGSNVVLEVHGHLRTASCPRCGGQEQLLVVLDRVREGEVPPLCQCGGVLRPDVVLFGDPLPQAFQLAWQWTRVCDLLIVVGSSLEVAPVCWLVPDAKRVALINLEPTGYDDLAETIIRGKAGEVLTSLLRRLEPPGHR